MTIENVAAPLAQALALKGYEALTSVQDAVLAEGVAGRDLLVSAQTGSGKTVAFGLAIAPEVLNGQDALLYADHPLALVIAPTRELALQVARELEWLYAGAGAKIATCVGGMDYRTEKRALERGAHIVVGTPGRLRDHIERRSLDLSGLKAAVLDEADEMLDLGFAEDLEFILAAAPEERRTLMFSATVPKEIEKLAGTFQKDALRIQAQGEAKQHVDIEYQALSVAVRDREHAIFNVLRYYDARTAIVFCKTRVNVNHLLARMGNRGFQVVALSGELSQQERTHALQALRDGRARVCIATDVAARGIDLPGLELVIHADLPSNSETLLHRSGRTGRAGKKGVSALIVTPAEYKKAQRLLAGAKVVAEWGSAPGADDVQAKDDLRILEHPSLTMPIGDDLGIATDLLEQFGAEALAAAFVRLWREGRSAPEVLSTDLPVPPPSAPRERGEFGPSVWFRISVGRAGRAEARWLLPKICDAGSIAKDGIGAIRVREDETFVQISEALASRFGGTVELDKGLTMERIEGEPDLDKPRFVKPERAERPERREKPAYVPKPPRVVEEGEADALAREYTPKPKPKYEPRVAASEARPEWKDKRQDDRPARPAYSDRAPRAEGVDEAPKKPRWSPDQKSAPRSTGFKSHGGAADRPARAVGYKSHASEGGGYKGKPENYKPRDEGAAPRAEGDRPARKPYAAKTEGYKPRGDYAPRAEGDRPARKPYAAKTEGYKPRSEGFKPREDGDRPARKPYAAKPEGFRPREDGDRPKKTYAPKGDDARPYVKREGAGKPGGPKSFGTKKPFDRAGASDRPAKPRADAKDTSKRFVPPKGPKR
ncbi:DEAD/DEAH box helicase [Tabrizicola sp.]|uniref:DEAD/DEAH box helicase n=1 Tax=Tabrizicola sp. TaxID=2005166 RepID=UPI002735A530|nr:DEAD/DEAH box helicase [Tabrizicola sp.]MDP3197321.1 DEAD/DEAH box helicase [Tabrizicola sp.]